MPPVMPPGAGQPSAGPPMGMQPPAPPPSQPPPAAQAIPITADEIKDWWDRINKAREVRKRVATWWDANLEAYAPDADDDPDVYGNAMNTNRDFTLVERKKADLFYQKPDIIAIPSPLMAGAEQLLDTHTHILNHTLGPDGVNAKAMVHRVLFDVLCPSGTGWTVMGYDQASTPTDVIHPITQQPMTVPVPVYEACYWEHVSPKQGLIPHDFKSTVWDDAPWLGYDFEIPLRVGKRRGWVDDSYEGDAPDPELHFDTGTDAAGAGDAVCKGVILFYKSALFRDDIVHPLHLTKLVLIEGQQDTAADHSNCPYQTLDAQGKLTPDSMLGNPIHPCTIRTLSDSAYVPSDCTITRSTVNELNRFRDQMIDQRDASIPRNLYNTDVLPTDALAKVVRSPIGGFIGVPGNAFTGETAIKPLQTGTYPRENFDFQQILDNDLARAHALDANQAGADNATQKTATEVNVQQGNVSARLGFERGVVLDWYVAGVAKYSTLLQRFYTVEQAAAIVGPQAAQAWDPWRKQVPSSLAFTARPDSTLRTDLAADRQRKMQEYTFFANDPYINRPMLLKELVTHLGYSPMVVNPQPPQKGPEPTKPTFSFKGEDLNPLAPQFAIVMAVLQQAGVNVPPQAIQEAQGAAQNALLAGQVVGRAQAGGPPPNGQQPHGGKLAAMEGLSKHAADLTGGMQGTGEPAPMGAAVGPRGIQ